MKNSSAFPNNNTIVGPEYGLTKREYFAAKALQGLMRAFATDPKEAASLAVIHAEALIKELEK